MSKDTEIKKEELQEMARAILSEIYSLESTRNGLEGLGMSPKANGLGFCFSDGELRSGGERQKSYEQAYNLNRQYVDTISDELSPRLKRGEFLEQRVLRRKVRQSVIGAMDETAEGMAENSNVRSESLPQADLPEKLSNIYCRDARRYDGAFEKY